MRMRDNYTYKSVMRDVSSQTQSPKEDAIHRITHMLGASSHSHRVRFRYAENKSTKSLKMYVVRFIFLISSKVTKTYLGYLKKNCTLRYDQVGRQIKKKISLSLSSIFKEFTENLLTYKNFENDQPPYSVSRKSLSD